MKPFRSTLAVLIAISLSSNLAYAGPEEDAQAYVESTRQGARDKARMIFNEYLEGAAIQASGVIDQSANLNMLSDRLKTQISDLQKLRVKLAEGVAQADMTLGSDNVDNVTGQLQDIYQTTSDLYVEAKSAEKMRDFTILNAGKEAQEIRNAFDIFLDNIKTTCQNGIAANFEYPNLPEIRPVLPSFTVGVNASVDSDGHASVAPQVPAAESAQLHGDAASAVYATSAAGGWILGAYLATGHLVLSGTAAAALTASQALIATGVGAAVAAVVAAVIYFSALFDAIEKSHEVSNAMWIVHNDKADAETVRTEFKSICQPFAERALKIKDRIQAYDNKDPKALAEIKEERARVGAEKAKLTSRQQALDQEMIQLIKELDADPSYQGLTPEQRRDVATKRLASTDAYKDMQTYVKNVKSDYLMDVFEMSLFDLGEHIVEVDRTMQDNYRDLFKKQTDEHLEKILKIAKLGRRMSIPVSIRNAIQSELNANSRIAGLFREFDSDFAGYVQNKLTLGQDSIFGPKLKQWLVEVRQAQKDLPASQTLKLLVQRGTSFLEFLGV